MLNPAQQAVIKAFIAADPFLDGQGADGDSLNVIRDALNAPFSPAFSVWRSSTTGASLANCIIWANLTPADSPTGTSTFTNQALVCQAKQINLQILLQGQSSVATKNANIRQGFQDALTNVPSGASGALQPAGWVACKVAMTRLATVAEKLLATGTGTGTPANPADLGYEGNLTSNDVDAARRS